MYTKPNFHPFAWSPDFNNKNTNSNYVHCFSSLSLSAFLVYGFTHLNENKSVYTTSVFIPSFVGCMIFFRSSSWWPIAVHTKYLCIHVRVQVQAFIWPFPFLLERSSLSLFFMLFFALLSPSYSLFHSIARSLIFLFS